MAEKRKKIHNPVTGKSYEVRQKTSKNGRKTSKIKGLWKDKNKGN